ncbi:MAG: preprotein translocase subunit YajC [Alphaproteobacteria bacterium]
MRDRAPGRGHVFRYRCIRTGGRRRQRPTFDQYLIQIAPLLLILPLLYFMMIRPQQRRMKAHTDMITSVKKGDTIVSAGGLVGKVKGVADDEIRVELAPNVEVRLLRGSIAEVRNKSEPAPANDSKPSKPAS